jgi:hypothetical protein
MVAGIGLVFKTQAVILFGTGIVAITAPGTDAEKRLQRYALAGRSHECLVAVGIDAGTKEAHRVPRQSVLKSVQTSRNSTVAPNGLGR